MRDEYCKAKVHERFGVGFRQCSNSPKPGSDFCGVHSPEAQERRRKRSDDYFRQKAKEDKARWERANERDRMVREYPQILAERDAAYAQLRRWWRAGLNAPGHWGPCLCGAPVAKPAIHTMDCITAKALAQE